MMHDACMTCPVNIQTSKAVKKGDKFDVHELSQLAGSNYFCHENVSLAGRVEGRHRCPPPSRRRGHLRMLSSRVGPGLYSTVKSMGDSRMGCPRCRSGLVYAAEQRVERADLGLGEMRANQGGGQKTSRMTLPSAFSLTLTMHTTPPLGSGPSYLVLDLVVEN